MISSPPTAISTGRSISGPSAKPFQAAVSQACGAGLAREQLAVACGSHDGEPVHVALVEAILAGAGLSADDLGNPPDWPLAGSADRRLVAAGATEPNRLWHNCSGKHAAMLAATVASGWDPASYLEPAHPLQTRITDFMKEIAGPVDPIGVDGCGAPVFATTARRWQGICPAVDAHRNLWKCSTPCMPSRPWSRVWATSMPPSPPISMRSASGERRASLGSACGDGWDMAVKVWDGSGLVAGVAALAALDQLGELTPYRPRAVGEAFAPLGQGGGKPVGRFEPRLELRWQ